MKWKLKPAIGNVVVEPQGEEEITKAGLILPSGSLERETHIAEVVAVCDPYEATAADRTLARAGPIYSLGQLVIIGKYNGRDIKLREDASRPPVRYIIIRETDILGTLEEQHVAVTDP